MTAREQERDARGRYAHEDSGLIAVSADAEWSICGHCDRVRRNGAGRWLPMTAIPRDALQVDSTEPFWED